MERYEPLKDKMKTMIGARPLPEFNFFYADEVKSAVQGLLEDVRARIPHRNCDCDVCMKLNWVIDDIKKWFLDVVEDENKKGDDNAGN